MSADLQPLLLLNLVLVLALCVALAYVAWKCRRILFKQYESERLADRRIDNVYSQMEALLSLDKELALPGGLPPLRAWAGSPDFLRHVHRIASQLRPINIVECSSGASTVVLARTAQLNGQGHVFSLEHEPVYAAKTRAELARLSLQDFATVIDAPLRKHVLRAGEWQWYETAGLPPVIDLLVIDGPPMTVQAQARYPAVAVLNDRITPSGYVVLDDAARPDERAAVRRWETEFGFVSAEELFAEKGIAVLRRSAA